MKGTHDILTRDKFGTMFASTLASNQLNKYTMNTTAQFTAKFDNVNFTATEHDKVIGDYRGNKFEVSISTRILEVLSFCDTPVQVIIRVRINGTHIISWGSDSNECNMELVKWFKGLETKARKAEREQERHDEQQANSLFESL